MKFVYHALAGEEKIILKDDIYTHAIKARRAKVGEKIEISDLIKPIIYSYEIESIGRKDAILMLQSPSSINLPKLKQTVVSWGMVDPKIVEKALPVLNELGVKTVALVRLDYSQGNFKYDKRRMERILINSSMQCGRMEIMEVLIFDSLEKWLEVYPDGASVDFGGETFNEYEVSAFLVGCEGGFSQRERNLLEKNPCWALKSPFILRSENAILSMSAKIFS